MVHSIFASFHYGKDAHRVQQVLNMGAIEGDSRLIPQKWESVRRKTDDAIERWIHQQMLYKRAIVVMVGAETASRPWVAYEIRKAWDDGRPLVGIRIHGLKNLDGRTSSLGDNPFAKVRLQSGAWLDSKVELHNPVGSDSKAVYKSITDNIDSWITRARKRG